MTREEMEAECNRLRATLRAIKDLRPEPIGDSGLVTGPAALLASAQRLASDALSTSPRSAKRLDSMLTYSAERQAAHLAALKERGDE